MRRGVILNLLFCLRSVPICVIPDRKSLASTSQCCITWDSCGPKFLCARAENEIQLRCHSACSLSTGTSDSYLFRQNGNSTTTVSFLVYRHRY
ncbi:hypothetical protein EDD18DRAFT_1139917, partial [Armillaria luteobubalina]